MVIVIRWSIETISAKKKMHRILDGFLAPPLHIHNILKGFNYFLLRVRSDLEKSKNSKAFDPLLIVIYMSSRSRFLKPRRHISITGNENIFILAALFTGSPMLETPLFMLYLRKFIYFVGSYR